jgi:hypothetical protein
VEAQKLLAQQPPVVLMNPFPHGKNLAQASSSMEGGQGPPLSSSNPSSANVYMMKGSVDIMTRTCDYGMPNTSEKGKEAENPSLPLHIEKTLGETMTHPQRCIQESFPQPKCKGHPELLCGGGFVTNPLCNVSFGSPPEFPFLEKGSVSCLRIY